MSKDAKRFRFAPGFGKYRITTMDLRLTNAFPNEPNPEWVSQELAVGEKDITRVFGGFKEELLRKGQVVSGPVGFTPEKFDRVKVYFNLKDSGSLYIVAETEIVANLYVLKGLKFRRRAYNQAANPHCSDSPLHRTSRLV
jgi:hypothetical protein